MNRKLEVVRKQKVLIIGAGIAGPAMALQLRRLGYDVTVFEARAEQEMNEGVFLGLTPNGLNVLARFIDISNLRDEYTPGKMVFYNARNKQIGVLGTDHQLATYGAETIQVKRAAISRLLREEAARKAIPIHYGYRLADIHQDIAGVRVVFDNKYEATADFIIGCDGTHSRCRSVIFPTAPGPVYTKQLSAAGMVRLPQLAVPFGQINMVFGKQAFFAFALSNTGELWWFDNLYREKQPTKEEIKGSLQREIRARLLEIHGGDPDPICEIIAGTTEILAYPVFEMPPLPRWYHGRVCLAGDAAHATAPHIGQGASMALEDCITLPLCLVEAGNVTEAFARFQALRQPRVERLIRTARKVGNNKTRSRPVKDFFRDALLKHFLKKEISKMHWVYSYRPEYLQ